MISEFLRYLYAAGMSTWKNEGMAGVTRAESTQRTRQRLLAEAQRLFRERGYAATSLALKTEGCRQFGGAVASWWVLCGAGQG